MGKSIVAAVAAFAFAVIALHESTGGRLEEPVLLFFMGVLFVIAARVLNPRPKAVVERQAA